MHSTQDILNLYWDGTLPIDMLKILNKMDIPYSFGDIEFIQLTRENFKYSVIISDKLSTSSVRVAIGFILAYIIYIEEENFSCSFPKSVIGLHNNSPANILATNFSISVTTPKKIIMYLITKKKISTIEKLSESFDVPQQFMQKSLYSQKVIS